MTEAPDPTRDAMNLLRDDATPDHDEALLRLLLSWILHPPLDRAILALTALEC